MKAVKTPGRKMIALLLALAVGLSCTGGALAADNTRYEDVAENAWYAEAVDYCHDLGLIMGTGEGRFSPAGTMTRGMLTTILWRLEFSPRPKSSMVFMDNMDWDAWYFQAVNWANENDIAKGYGNGLFGVNDPVTREQFATILFNYAVYKNPELAPVMLIEDYETENGGMAANHYLLDPETLEEPAVDFKDAAFIADYARYAVGWAKEQRIISGKPGNLFDPKGRATRAEAAVIIHNYLLPFDQRPEPVIEPEKPEDPVDPEDPNAFYILVGEQSFEGRLADNATAQALKELMPFTVDMRELGGNEKFYNLYVTLPVNAQIPEEIRAGDLLLYRNNSLVLFYQDATPYYRYTPLGRITDPEGLAQALAGDPVKVSFDLGSAPAPAEE